MRSACRSLLALLALCSYLLLCPHLLIAQSSEHESYYSNIRFTRLLHGEGMRENDNINAITSIKQDHNGYMWFCGESGVARYNGVDFEIFQKKNNDPNSLSGSYAWDALEDHSGVMWIATAEGLNRFNPERHNFTRYTSEQSGEGVQLESVIPSNILHSLALGKDNTLYIGSAEGLFEFNPQRTVFVTVPELHNKTVHQVFVDVDDGLWVGTERHGLFYRSIKNGKFVSWVNNRNDDHSIPLGSVRAIERDRNGDVWVGTFGAGLARFNLKDQRFQRYQHRPEQALSLGSNNIWDIHLDKEGKLWIATDPGGLNLYDPEVDGFRAYRNNIYDVHSLISDKVRAIYDDSFGDVWVGVFPSGAHYFDKTTAHFYNKTSIPNDPSSLSNDLILRLFEDSKKQLWVGTERGLNLMDTESMSFTRFLANANNPQDLQSDSVLALAEDVSGDLWVGTWSGGAYRFNQKTGVFKQYSADGNNPNSLGDDFVWDILRDSKDRVWFGTERNGLSLYRPETDDFVVFRPDASDESSLSFKHVWVLMEDSKNRLWVGTMDGLNQLIDVEGDRARFKHYRHDSKNLNSISSNRIISMYEDSLGRIWVGTQDAGLNWLNPETGESVRITVADGLPSKHISSIVEDEAGYIWVSTVNGIALVDPLTKRIRSFSESNGLVSNNFNRNASYRSAGGDLFFGGTKGLSIFNPSVFHKTMLPPKVVLSSLKLFNHPVYASSENSPIDEPIADEDEIILSYKDSMFSLEFFAVSYRVAHRNQYSYKLEGFDKDWNDVNSNVATYTNIDPGVYEFKVRAANSDGVWNRDGRSVKIIVKPPLWNTPIAYALYFIVLLASVWFFLLNQRKKIELHSQKALNQKLLKVDRMKDAFLANTSHELRTPLNGIIGLAESLHDGAMGPITPSMAHSLKMISTSGRRLSNLINDILDHSKLHENKLDIHLKSTLLYEVSNVVVELLLPLVGTKNLKLINDVPEDVYVLADADRLQQILLNLVGNAVKFSDSGYVRIYVDRHDDEKWAVSVEDTGPGIPESQIETIFDVFTQLDNKETREQGGTGLGLTISKQLVELHGGELLVRSSLGEGSTFTFYMRDAQRDDRSESPIPVDLLDGGIVEGFLNKSTVMSGSDLNEVYASFDIEQESVSLLKPFGMCSLYTILIVDDDAVNRLVLSGILSVQHYRVIEAQNGIEALQVLASGAHVDMVIMDVMMPKMSGYETCMRLRVDFPVHVLPVVFLTAKCFNTDIVRGFVAGGSDFLKKPVSKHDLLSRVSSHLSMLEINRGLESKYQEAQAKNKNNQRELTVLDHMMDVINRELDFNTILKKLLDDVKDLLDADQIVYWQAKSDAQNVSHCKVFASDSDVMSELCLHDGELVVAHLQGLCCSDEKVLILNDFEDEVFSFIGDTFEESKSAILMAICFESQLMGFITVLINDRHRQFSEDTIETLNRLQSHITSAIIKAKLLERLGMDVSELKGDS